MNRKKARHGMASKVHDLKISMKYMDAQLAGIKNFEIRKNDRDYKVGDRLWLREWNGQNYTGRKVTVYVTYITDYAQRDGYVVLGTSPIGRTSGRLVQNSFELA